MSCSQKCLKTPLQSVSAPNENAAGRKNKTSQTNRCRLISKFLFLRLIIFKFLHKFTEGRFQFLKKRMIPMAEHYFGEKFDPQCKNSVASFSFPNRFFDFRTSMILKRSSWLTNSKSIDFSTSAEFFKDNSSRWFCSNYFSFP